MSDYLGQRWRAYRTQVIPLEAPALQAQVCWEAFHAGAWTMLNLLRQASTLAEGEAIYREILGEFKDFMAAYEAARG